MKNRHLTAKSFAEMAYYFMKDVSFANKLKKRTTKEILIDIFEQIITFYDEGVLY